DRNVTGVQTCALPICLDQTFSKVCGFSGQSPESHPAGCETPPFIFAQAKMNQTKNKKRGRSRATPLRPKAAHANQPAGLVCRDLVPDAKQSPAPNLVPGAGRSAVWDEVPVKGEPS